MMILSFQKNYDGIYLNYQNCNLTKLHAVPFFYHRKDGCLREKVEGKTNRRMARVWTIWVFNSFLFNSVSHPIIDILGITGLFGTSQRWIWIVKVVYYRWNNVIDMLERGGITKTTLGPMCVYWQQKIYAYHAFSCFYINCYTFVPSRYYINYKLMKKKVKQYANQIEAGALDRRHVLKDFSRMLDNQVNRNLIK